MKRLLRALLWLCLVLGMGACSSVALTRLAYNNAALAYTNLAPMLTWAIDDYVDLGGAREDWVRARVDRALAWHRHEELPRYRTFLESVLARSDAPFRVADIAAHQRELRAGYHRVIAQVIPDIAEFLSTLDSTEIAHMERKFAEDNRKYVRDSVRGTPEERLGRRAKRFIEHLESWVGPLETSQRALVIERYSGVIDLSEELLGERRYRQSETVALVKSKPPRVQMEAALKHILIDTDSWRRPEYTQKLREREMRMHTLVADLSATLTERQRTALQKRIRGFLRDIANVSGSTAASSSRGSATRAS